MSLWHRQLSREFTMDIPPIWKKKSLFVSWPKMLLLWIISAIINDLLGEVSMKWPLTNWPLFAAIKMFCSMKLSPKTTTVDLPSLDVSTLDWLFQLGCGLDAYSRKNTHAEEKEKWFFRRKQNYYQERERERGEKKINLNDEALLLPLYPHSWSYFSFAGKVMALHKGQSSVFTRV